MSISRTRWCLAGLLAIGGFAGTVAAQTVRPNIVIVLADDLGFGDLGCYSAASRIPTPRCDALADAGVRLTDAHSGSAVCTPTRYTVLAGRYAWRTRLKKGVFHGYDGALISPDRVTLPGLLRANGYVTAMVGKWHLGLDWALSDGEPALAPVDFERPFAGGPCDAGFQTFFGISASLDMPPYCFLRDRRVETVPTQRIEASPQPAYWRAGAHDPGFVFEDVLPAVWEESIRFIQRRAMTDSTEPFFLYVALPAPHLPIVPTDAFRGRSGAGAYGDFVCQVDDGVGRLYDALRAGGFADDTLFIVTSDNGAYWWPKDIDAHGHRANGPWRGQKADIYEGGHRVPLLAAWPGHIAPGVTADATACLTDLFATCAAAARISVPDGAAEDSVDLLPLLTGQNALPARTLTVHHSLDGMYALRAGAWKLIFGLGSGGFTAPKRVEPDDDGPAVQLYHLGDDPGETTNLALDRPDVVAELTTAFERIRGGK